MPKSPESNPHRRKGKPESNSLQRERDADIAWLTGYLSSFATVVREQHKNVGRGALVVDTTRVVPGFGNPIAYLPQTEVTTLNWPRINQMVENYRPETQMVIVLLKDGGAQSAYSIVMPPSSPELN